MEEVAAGYTEALAWRVELAGVVSGELVGRVRGQGGAETSWDGGEPGGGGPGGASWGLGRRRGGRRTEASRAEPGGAERAGAEAGRTRDGGGPATIDLRWRGQRRVRRWGRRRRNPRWLPWSWEWWSEAMCVFSFFLSGRARAVSLDRIGPIRYTPRALYTPRATLGLAFPVFFSFIFLLLFFHYFSTTLA